MEVLILLVGRAGSLVPRRDIQSALWSADVFVEHDAAINTAIRKVRQVLGDDADTPRFIETIVGKGYRFIAPVEIVPHSEVRGRGSHIVNSIATRGRAFPTYRVTRGKQEFLLDVEKTYSAGT